MANKVIICPQCGSTIEFAEGTIVERCVACQTEFVKPGAVKVSAQPSGTVVQVEPLNFGAVANPVGGN